MAFNRTAYANDYIRQNYDRFTLTAPKGTKDEWKENARKRGMSLSQYVQNAVREYKQNQENREL